MNDAFLLIIRVQVVQLISDVLFFEVDREIYASFVNRSNVFVVIIVVIVVIVVAEQQRTVVARFPVKVGAMTKLPRRHGLFDVTTAAVAVVSAATVVFAEVIFLAAVVVAEAMFSAAVVFTVTERVLVAFDRLPRGCCCCCCCPYRRKSRKCRNRNISAT